MGPSNLPLNSPWRQPLWRLVLLSRYYRGGSGWQLSQREPEMAQPLFPTSITALSILFLKVPEEALSSGETMPLGDHQRTRTPGESVWDTSAPTEGHLRPA